EVLVLAGEGHGGAVGVARERVHRPVLAAVDEGGIELALLDAQDAAAGDRQPGREDRGEGDPEHPGPRADHHQVLPSERPARRGPSSGVIQALVGSLAEGAVATRTTPPARSTPPTTNIPVARSAAVPAWWERSTPVWSPHLTEGQSILAWLFLFIADTPKPAP